MTREQAQALGIAEIAEAERKLTMISQDQILQTQHEHPEGPCCAGRCRRRVPSGQA